MSPYPDGTGPNDPNAPWNQQEPEECVECDGVWTEDGHKPVSETTYVCQCSHEWEVDASDTPQQCPECGSADIRKLPCPHEGETMTDLEETQRAEKAEMRMDEMRIEEMLSQP